LFNVNTSGLNVAELCKSYPHLVVDTSLFEPKFQAEVLSNLHDLDEKTNGLLIHSDNFQALNFLQERYKEQVKCIYIDPPYNTNASEIIYKNGYKHSSWLSLMHSRIEIGQNLHNSKGLLLTAIDDTELRYLHNTIETIYGYENFVANLAIQQNPRGRSDAMHIAPSHEYTLLYAKNLPLLETNELVQSVDDLNKKYPKYDDISSYRELPLRRSGSNSKRTERPNLFFPIYFDRELNKLSLEKSVNSIEILPIDTEGVERCWRWGKEKLIGTFETEIIVKSNGDAFNLYTKDRLKNTIKPKSFWYGAKHDASSHGTMLLKNLFLNQKIIIFS